MSHSSTGPGPVTVADVGGRHIELTPLDARLVDALLRRRGNWCSTQALLDAGWPDGGGATMLTHRLLTLNRRLRPVGLRILTHPDRGAALERNPAGAPG